MLCHQYFGLSGFNDKGQFKIHYINEDMHKRSPHGVLECKDCHAGIKEVPHKNVKPVNCTVECHIDEPSRKRPYSHKSVAKLVDKSVHAKKDKDGKLKKYQKDYPSCRDCHDQPLYRTLATMANSHESVSERSISRCSSCHEKDFSEKYFVHVATRLQRQTNPINRIEVCSGCHGEKGMLERHKMDDTVSSYKETFHYKKLRLGSEKTPDCIDCHAHSTNGHIIKSKKDPSSPTHKKNVGKTCQQADCHEKADVKLAGFQTHVTYEFGKYPLQYILLLFFKIVMTIVLYSFLIMVFLELLRRLFPKFTFRRTGD